MDKTINVKCEFCGIDFLTSEIEYKRFIEGRKKHVCCSRLCANRLVSRNNRGENNVKYTSIIKICEYCKKEYKANKCEENISKFCSKECQGKYKTERATIILTCQYCGKEFPVLKGQIDFFGEQKYCSKECRGDARKKRVYKNCLICGKLYWEHLAYAEKSICCSRKCLGVWLSTVYYQIPEVNDRLKLQGTNSQRKQKKSLTLPELLVLEYLTKENIVFIPQYTLDNKYIIDFYIPEYNCCLEVYGDYWHSNPLKYGNNKRPLNEIQIKIHEKDIKKESFLINSYNYYRLWEYDIKNNLEESMNNFFNNIISKIRNEQVIL